DFDTTGVPPAVGKSNGRAGCGGTLIFSLCARRQSRQRLDAGAPSLGSVIARVVLLSCLLAASPPLLAEDPRAWRLGVFGDVAYLRDPNRPANHLFRGRGTAFHLNEWD